MKKYIAFLLFFGCFNVTLAGLEPLDIQKLWPQILTQPTSENAPASEMRSSSASKCNKDLIPACKRSGEQAEGEPNGIKGYTCSTDARCNGVRPGHRNFSRNPCRPIGCSVSDMKPALTVAVRISAKKCLPDGRFQVSVRATASGGTPPYRYAWTPSGGAGSIGRFILNIGAELNASVVVTDANGSKVTGMISVNNACPRPKLSCESASSKKECDSLKGLKCVWNGYACKGQDLVCKGGGKIDCTSDEECKDLNPETPLCLEHYPNPQGPGIKQCLSDLQCRQFTRCLSSSARISTPIGAVRVTDLKVGDIVWTVDAAGNRVVRSLIKVSRVAAPNHRVIELILVDGRTLDVSPLHPTADTRTVGDLKAGDAYDGSTVQSAELKSYEGTATYDILPAGDTGFYFANGIVMGSTLK